MLVLQMDSNMCIRASDCEWHRRVVGRGLQADQVHQHWLESVVVGGGEMNDSSRGGSGCHSGSYCCCGKSGFGGNDSSRDTSSDSNTGSPDTAHVDKASQK